MTWILVLAEADDSLRQNHREGLIYPSARIQFLSALAFIRRDSPPAAARFRDRAEKVLRGLEEFPESGRVVPEFPEYCTGR